MPAPSRTPPRSEAAAEPASGQRQPSLLLVSLAVGFCAGWIETAIVFWPRLTTGSLVSADEHSIWIAPVSASLWMTAAGAAAHLLTIATRSRGLHRVLMSGVIALGAFGVGWLFFPKLHRFAIVLLALGAGIQLGRLAARRPDRARRWFRTIALSGTVLTAGTAVVATAIPVFREWRARRALSPANGNGLNVLLLILDTVRAESLSLYGASRPTSPGLDTLATRGTVFWNAYATTSWTLPSHASMFTGDYPYEMSADWTKPLRDRPTLAETLARHGYRTGGFVANLQYTAAETGLARGFARYDDWPVSLHRIAAGSSLGRFVLDNRNVRQLLRFYRPWPWKTGDEVARQFLGWLDRSDGGRPFFGFLNLYDAHEPYLSPEPFESMFGATRTRLTDLVYGRAQAGRPVEDPLGAEELESDRAAYDGGIVYLDAVIDRLLAALATRGVLDSTIVIVTSDHGEAFGELGVHGHGNALYPQTLRVPLVLIGPRVPAGRRVNDAVTLRDLSATVLQLLDIPDQLPGTSLSIRWHDSTAATSSPVLAELWPAKNQSKWMPVWHGYMRSMTRLPWMVIRRGDGQEEFVRVDSAAILGRDAPADTLALRLRDALLAVPRGNYPNRQ